VKNERAPRTLAECSFPVGYRYVPPRPARGRLADWLLAVALGVAFAVVIVYGGA